MKAKFIAAGLILCLGCVSTAQATTISITGVANNTDYGYVQGQTYTLNWVLNSFETQNPSSTHNATDHAWTEETTADTRLFTNVYGDGLTETLAPQSSDPFSFFQVNAGGDGVQIAADDDLGPIGLQVAGLEVNSVWFDAYSGVDPDWNLLGVFQNPATYAADHAGSYSVLGAVMGIDHNSGNISFDTVTMTVTAGGAVPEPATLLLTLLGLGLLPRRRGKQRR